MTDVGRLTYVMARLGLLAVAVSLAVLCASMIVLPAEASHVSASELPPGEVLWDYRCVGPNTILEVRISAGKGARIYVMSCPEEELAQLWYYSELNTTALEAFMAQEDVKILANTTGRLVRTFCFEERACVIAAVANEGSGFPSVSITMTTKVRLVPLDRGGLFALALGITGAVLALPHTAMRITGRVS